LLKTKEVLTSRFEVGLGLRQIARSCSIGRDYNYVRRSGQKLRRMAALEGFAVMNPNSQH
jgi:hypothetical protein